MRLLSLLISFVLIIFLAFWLTKWGIDRIHAVSNIEETQNISEFTIESLTNAVDDRTELYQENQDLKEELEKLREELDEHR